MSDPKRLLHGGGGPFSIELLAAGRDELPSEAALLEAGEAASHMSHGAIDSANAIHAASSGSALTGAPAVSGAIQSAGVSAGAAKVGVSVAALSKWVGIAAVGIGISSAAPSALRWLEPAPVPPTAAKPLVPAELTSVPAQEKPTEPPDTAPAPSVESQARAPHGSEVLPVRAAPRVPARSSLDELRLVDSAREALQSGDAARTLDLLQHYEARIVERQFELEVAVLRMEALARLGRTEAARERARQVLARAPSERQAARARAILDRRGSFE
jgi:hypothetical protein